MTDRVLPTGGEPTVTVLGTARLLQTLESALRLHHEELRAIRRALDSVSVALNRIAKAIES